MDISTKAECPPCVSYLRKTYIGDDGLRTLHQAKITEMVAHHSFADFAANFSVNAAYPQAQAHKQESFGFLPTLFEESGWVSRRDPSRPPQWGLWRRAEHSAHEVTLMYLDLDNAVADRSFVTLDEMEAMLKALGLSHILYSSFSHTAERHKVRAVLLSSHRTEPVDFRAQRLDLRLRRHHHGFEPSDISKIVTAVFRPRP